MNFDENSNLVDISKNEDQEPSRAQLFMTLNRKHRDQELKQYHSKSDIRPKTNMLPSL